MALRFCLFKRRNFFGEQPGALRMILGPVQDCRNIVSFRDLSMNMEE